MIIDRNSLHLMHLLRPKIRQFCHLLKHCQHFRNTPFPSFPHATVYKHIKAAILRLIYHPPRLLFCYAKTAGLASSLNRQPIAMLSTEIGVGVTAEPCTEEQTKQLPVALTARGPD